MRTHWMRLLSVMLTAILTMTVSFRASASVAFSADQPRRTPDKVEMRPAYQDIWTQSVTKLTPMVVRKADGTFSLTVDRVFLFTNQIPAKLYDEIQVGMKVVNQEILAGRLASKADLSVYSPSIKSESSILANQQGFSFYWWGIRLALNSTTTNRIVALTGIAGGATAIAAVLANVVPGAGQLGMVVLGVISGALWMYGSWLSYLNAPGNGIYLHFTWTGNLVWGSSQ